MILSDINDIDVTSLAIHSKSSYRTYIFDHTDVEETHVQIKNAISHFKTIDISIHCVGQGCRSNNSQFQFTINLQAI